MDIKVVHLTAEYVRTELELLCLQQHLQHGQDCLQKIRDKIVAAERARDQAQQALRQGLTSEIEPDEPTYSVARDNHDKAALDS